VDSAQKTEVTPVNALLAALKVSISQHHPLRLPAKRRVELLLGNDREIGRETRSQEKRVGITPEQVSELRGFFADLRLELNVLVMAGAGQRAGFADADFVAAGAEILTPEELEYHDGPPDVVHALKEPSRYEGGIPGPFCRIGALHTGDFHSEGGLAGLLRKGNVAIFDGSHTGAPDAFRIPIRGGMSIFAGEIAAEWVLEHLRHRHATGKVVVVGAGNAGRAALRKLAAEPEVTAVHLLDSADDPGRLDQIRAGLADVPKATVEGISGIDHAHLLRALDDAVAVVFAVARPREAAPRVVHINSLKQRLAEGAVVVDISIDEKGAIQDPEIRRTWSLEQIIEHLTRSLAGSRHRAYRALANMPRAYPRQASAAHGEVVLPYLATLLFLAAREGGAEGAIRYLAGRPFDGRSPDPGQAEPARVLDALVQDLRNGMAFYPHGGRLGVSSTVADRASVFDFLYRQKIPFEFSAPAAPIRSEADRERERMAFSVFPDPLRDCLTYAVDRDLRFTVISHPGIDGTRTENAERALGVPADKVLKCLVFRADERYVAAVCTGRKHILKERLRELTGAREVHLASPDEVLKVTGHTKGGVPAVQVFATVSAVYVDDRVMQQEAVYGSAGTELAGMRIAPAVLKSLGALVARITPEDSRLRKSETKVQRLLEKIRRAIEEDDDAAARGAVDEISYLLELTASELK
jgi:alanine dehydrogenase